MELLKEYLVFFKSFSIFARILGNAFNHLNNHYLKFNYESISTYSIALKIFKEIVVENTSAKVVSSLSEMINLIREEKEDNFKFVREIINIFITAGIEKDLKLIKENRFETKWKGVKNLKVYTKFFEDNFHQGSTEYYAIKYTSLCENLDFSDFVKLSVEIFEKEKILCKKFLEQISIDKIKNSIIQAIQKNKTVTNIIK